MSPAITYRNPPETPVPIRSVTVCRPEPLLRTGPLSARSPIANRNDRPNTTEEWPSENHRPVLSGRLRSAISFRVVLSIAAMWSASNACRNPSVYAVRPSPTVNAPDVPSR